MFGLGTFGTLTFGQSPGAVNVYFVTVAETATAADSASSLAAFLSSVLEVAAVSDSQSSIAAYAINVFEISGITAVNIGNTTYPVSFLESVGIASEETEGGSGVFGEFRLSGEATLEFVGTTRFVDMIEKGSAELGIAVEIRTRSL